MAKLLTMIALWAIAAWHRLKVLNEAVIGSDSLGPYLQAQAARFGHMPRPPNPESGDALWFLMLPFVAVAQNLSELFTLRFVAGGLVAPIGFAAAYHWICPSEHRTRRWAAGLTAGVFLAFDPGLLDTLVSGARSYAAPELIGATTLFLAMAVRQYPWAPHVMMIAFVAAIGHHPLAIGMGLGAMMMTPTIHRSVGGRRLKLALILGGIACLPRILRVASILTCGEGVMACLSQVAQSNIIEPEPLLSLIGKALHDRWLVDLDVTGWVLLGGLGSLLLCTKKEHRKAAQWAIWGSVGILLVGVLNGYIRSYHLRITAVPIAVAAAMGLSRAWPVALLASTVFIWRTHTLLPVGPDPGALARQDQVMSQLPQQTLWIDRVWWEGIPRLDPSAVVLSGWLQGRRDFLLDRNATFILLESHTREEGWSVRQFPNVNAGHEWVDLQDRVPHQRGGAYDWATIAEPNTKLEDARW